MTEFQLIESRSEIPWPDIPDVIRRHRSLGNPRSGATFTSSGQSTHVTFFWLKISYLFFFLFFFSMDFCGFWGELTPETGAHGTSSTVGTFNASKRESCDCSVWPSELNWAAATPHEVKFNTNVDIFRPFSNSFSLSCCPFWCWVPWCPKRRSKRTKMVEGKYTEWEREKLEKGSAHRSIPSQKN